MIIKPEVSVLIPTYNRAHYLPDAISSVLSQTYYDFEIIIIDDGSTDNSQEVVKSFSDKRIKYLYQENQGISRALNTGLKNASGRYIARLDSDDIWIPKLLEIEKEYLDNFSEVGLVFSQAQAMDAHGKALPQISGAPEKFSGQFLKSILYGDFVCAVTTLIRKECYDIVGPFDETLKGNEDWDMWIRLADITKFYFVDQILAYFRMHEGRTTSSRSIVFTDITNKRLQPLDKYYSKQNIPDNILKIKPLAYRNANIDIGLKWLAQGNYKKTLSNFILAIKIGKKPIATIPRIIYLIFFYRYLSKREWGVRVVEKLARFRRHVFS